MIHLAGIVFQGGVGIPLFTDPQFFQDRQPDMIWGLVTAMQTVAQSVLGKEIISKGTSEMKCGKVRFVMFDPFLDMTDSVRDKLNRNNLDTYVIMAMQDLYDNLEVTLTKLREIHNILIDNDLGLSRPHASVGFSVHKSILKLIKEVVLRTQQLPEDKLDLVQSKISDFITENDRDQVITVLVVSIADIDQGLLCTYTTKYLYEDTDFTELILSNIVAENPSDSKTVWIEREAPLWIDKQTHEAFILEHIGHSTDFRLLARICFLADKREEARNMIAELARNLDKIITTP